MRDVEVHFLMKLAHPAHRRPACLSAISTAFALAGAVRAIALPLFDTSARANCADCHVSAPALNAAGMRFLRAGYRFSGAVAQPAHVPGISATLELGAEVSRLHTPAPGGGPGSSVTDGQFRDPALDVHSAGVLSEHVSFHVEASFDSASGPVRVPVASVQFDDIAPGGSLALRAGRFDAGLPFLSSARRLTRREYLAPAEVDAHGFELFGSHAAWRTRWA